MALFKKPGKKSYSQWGVEWNLGNKYNQRLPVFGLGSKNYNTVMGHGAPRLNPSTKKAVMRTLSKKEKLQKH